MGGFLGSLMGSMEETHKSVAGTAAGELFTVGRPNPALSPPSPTDVPPFSSFLLAGLTLI